jgi:protein phosphatase
MAESDGPRAVASENSDPFAESLAEVVEPIDETAHSAPLSPGTKLLSDDDEPLTVVALVQDKYPVRLYEAALEDDETLLWLWERPAGTASSLADEVTILKTAQCPIFPRFQSSFQLDGRAYLACEKCDGETLATILAAGRPEPVRAVSILSQVAFALTRLHAIGFAHLALRPGVMIPGRPVKIVEFSDATRIGEMRRRQFYYAGYSAPELLNNEPADIRSDIYSVGALLFHAISGAPIPETGVELLSWESKNSVAGVPQILYRCLGPKESRYATMNELHRDLLRLVKRLSPLVRYTIGGATSIGLEPSRTTNQDAYTYCLGRFTSEDDEEAWAVACVADGMGGMEAGEAASAAVVRGIQARALSAVSAPRFNTPEAHAVEVKSWMHEANDRVISALERRGAKGGSTVVCACLVGTRLAVSHVGDCRVYLIRNGEMKLLTRDHSLAMALVLQGEIPMSDLRSHPDRSKVTRSLGDRCPMPDHLIDTLEQGIGHSTMELVSGDLLLLCSDGLWEPLNEAEMMSLIQANPSCLDTAAEALVKATLAKGGADNATVVLVRLMA